MNTLRTLKRTLLRSLATEFERRILSRWLKKAQWQGVVLDVGGGGSPYAPYLQQAQVLNLNLELREEVSVLGDAHALPFADGCISGVLLTNVLEHVREPGQVLSEITRVLKPGGELLLVVPLLFKVHPNPEDHWRFTWQGLEYLLGSDYTITAMEAPGGRCVVAWEMFGQVRVLQPLRILNRLIARLPLRSKDYALCYCVRLKKI